MCLNQFTIFTSQSDITILPQISKGRARVDVINFVECTGLNLGCLYNDCCIQGI